MNVRYYESMLYHMPKSILKVLKRISKLAFFLDEKKNSIYCMIFLIAAEFLFSSLCSLKFKSSHSGRAQLFDI